MEPIKRLKILTTVNPDDLQPVTQYELDILKALHPIGQLSNMANPGPLPQYDDLADMINVIRALKLVEKSFTDMVLEIQATPR